MTGSDPSNSHVTVTLHVATASVVLMGLLDDQRHDRESPEVYTAAWHRAQAIDAIKSAMLAWPDAIATAALA